MKLTLFSHYVTDVHVEKLQTFFDKPLSEVKMLYINTPVRYKTLLPDWYYESHRRWLGLFPKMKEMDLAHVWESDPKFDFESYLSDFDFVFICGGNVFLLTYWLQKTGVGKIIHNQAKTGKYVYGGESAGAVVCYHDIKTLGIADDPAKAPAVVNDGLDLVDFVPVCHFDVDKFHEIMQKVVSRCKENGEKYMTYGDQEAIFVDNSKVELC